MRTHGSLRRRAACAIALGLAVAAPAVRAEPPAVAAPAVRAKPPAVAAPAVRAEPPAAVAPAVRAKPPAAAAPAESLAVAARVRAEPPALGSPSAAVIDLATADEVFVRAADEVRPIASMTKIFVALVLRRRHLDLDRWTEINFDDAKASAGGARTLLLEGQRFANRDLLHAMLLSSDNRVPSALARSVGLSNDELIERIGRVAEDLGLSHTRFDDATGIRGNASTAREMAIAMRETVRDPLLARIMTTRRAKITSQSEEITARYTSTVQPLWDARYKVLGGKTGHTDAAGYCLLIAVKIGKRGFVIALLGGKTPEQRFQDFEALVAWLSASPT